MIYKEARDTFRELLLCAFDVAIVCLIYKEARDTFRELLLCAFGAAIVCLMCVLIVSKGVN